MTPIKPDFHSHSTLSDGKLTPTQLLQRAQTQQVTMLALTDHDTTAGLEEAQQAATQCGIQLINGVEISTLWQNKAFHIVALNIDPKNPQLMAGLAKLQAIRQHRAEKIALKLQKKGISGALESVTIASNGGMITRPHFANFLMQQGYVDTMQQAFDKYLGQGKSAFVKTQWIELEQAIQWIQAAGGVSVVAHPLRYKLTASWFKRFLSAFKDYGGTGIEVITARQSLQETQLIAKYAQQYELLGSMGSDFHTPNNPWIELGRIPSLPNDIQAIWTSF